jgi:hypothetical protein
MLRWIDQGDGSFELQLLSTDEFPLAVENLPDARGFATGDIFVPHPTKKGLWKLFALSLAYCQNSSDLTNLTLTALVAPTMSLTLQAARKLFRDRWKPSLLQIH